MKEATLIVNVHNGHVHTGDGRIYQPSPRPVLPPLRGSMLPWRSWFVVAAIIAIAVGCLIALSGVKVPQL